MSANEKNKNTNYNTSNHSSHDTEKIKEENKKSENRHMAKKDDNRTSSEKHNRDEDGQSTDQAQKRLLVKSRQSFVYIIAYVFCLFILFAIANPINHSTVIEYQTINIKC